MKKILIGVFAHPDDEAFGPGGTILLEGKQGTEVHLMSLTAGESGVNPDNVENLAATRLAEWREAGRIMGVKSQHHLGFVDGELCNNDYHAVSAKVEGVIDEILQDVDSDSEIEMMCFDLNGISGHLDHILASRVAAYVFCKRQQQDTRFTRLRLFCIPKTALQAHNTDWLYMEAGRDEAEIDHVVDAREYADEIFTIIRAHHSQRSDGESHIARLGRDIGLNHFITLK